MPDSVLPPNISADRRMDPGSRKIIDRLAEINGHLQRQDVDLEAIRNDLKHHVTFKWLITVAFGFAVAVGGFAWKIGEDNRTAREAAILQIRQEQAATNVRVESKVDGVYKFLIEGKPKAEVRAEVSAEEKAADPSPKPGGGR